MSIRRPSVLLCLTILMVAVLIAFSPVMWSHSFVGDDHGHLNDNPRMNPVTWSGVKAYWTGPYISLYIPLTYTVWSAAARIGQALDLPTHGYNLNPDLFHLLNLLFHVLNALLVFFILKILCSERWPALVGALLFSLHPVQVESVAWIGEFRTQLGGCLSLAAILLYLKAFHPSASGRRSAAYLSLACYALALSAKPTSVAVPLMLLILNHFFLHAAPGKNLRLTAPWLILTVPLVIVTMAVQPPAVLQNVPLPRLRPLIAGDATAFYLYQLVFPDRLGFDYGRTPEFVLNHWWGYVTWILPVAAALGLYFGPRRYRPYLGCLCLFIAGFLSVAGLVPFVFQQISTVADRYLYLSMLGPALALAWLLTTSGNRFRTAAALALTILLIPVTLIQTTTWKNEETVLTQALAVNPRSSYAYHYLADCCYRNVPRGLALNRKALSLDPGLKNALSGLAVTLAHILEHNPPPDPSSLAADGNPEIEGRLIDQGDALQSAGRPRESLSLYGRALVLNPVNVRAHNNVAVAFLRLGLYEEAAAHLKAALKLSPRDALAHSNLGIAQYALGDRQGARAQFQAARQLDPNHAEIRHNAGQMDRQGRAANFKWILRGGGMGQGVVPDEV